jgi:hypothetical protein
MSSAVPNGDVAGSFCTFLWQRQKEVPDRLTPRNPYWRRILVGTLTNRGVSFGRLFSFLLHVSS